MDPRVAEVIKSVTDAAIKLADTKGVEVPTLQTLRGSLAQRDAAIRSALELPDGAPIDDTVISRVRVLRPAAPVPRPVAPRPAAAAFFPELGGVPLVERQHAAAQPEQGANAVAAQPEEQGGNAAAGAGAVQQEGGRGRSRKRVRRHRQKTQKRRVHFRKL